MKAIHSGFFFIIGWLYSYIKSNYFKSAGKISKPNARSNKNSTKEIVLNIQKYQTKQSKIVYFISTPFLYNGNTRNYGYKKFYYATKSKG